MSMDAAGGARAYGGSVSRRSSSARLRRRRPGAGKHGFSWRRAVVVFPLVLALVPVVAGCGVGAGGDDGVVELEFFQAKPEAVASFDALIAEFEAAHPGIDVRQNQVPNAGTALRTRLVKNDVPDVIALDGTATYGELAEAGVFADFTGDPALEAIQPGVVEVLNGVGSRPGETNGVPLSTNANGVLYNVEAFAELGLEPPTTWDELVRVCEEIEAAGRTPFAFTWKDAWTAMVGFNSLAASLAPEGFFDDREADRTTFAADFGEVAERFTALKEFGNEDPFGTDYNTGNAMFARGEALMLTQGIWAISAIKQVNPDITVGAFAMPAADDPADNRLVSGVDTVLTTGVDTEHPEEVREFIRFLTSKEASAQYIAEQGLFSARVDVPQQDPALASLNPYFASGQVTGYPEHRFAPAVPLQAITQEFLISEDAGAFLRELDDEWEKVQARS
ncbi:raffinose/stachyose/melibiose transport system substrate-binding protein [Allostreptomyces psammosilenae]|uniref:Raffinose/stachyose/melibiose transport system substrate-binding protein n=1 Tax=Allostreptomyces psammosilenae TaxID=1892865 RepID=A0A853A017_9ACTN|nr:raffinose/stachyose/melibiose transport system substrate-binding protein [Allostreptomyces psammosilenae]